ncbi:hypothetical protein PHSC3_000633 [Chlamydiales bacterium STE3]|nr:hypothetical protein PHSC3_000633 [Chlamydiales bacterium STE3]
MTSIKPDPCRPLSSSSSQQSSKKKTQKKDDSVTNVSVGIFNGWTKTVGSFVARRADGILSCTEKDAQFLKSLTGEDVASLIKKIAPQLSSLIKFQLPDFMKSEEGVADNISEKLLIYIVANLAAAQFPKKAAKFYSGNTFLKKVSLEELTQQIAESLFQVLAKGFNEVDEQVKHGAPLTPELFEKTSEELLRKIFPADSKGSLPHVLKQAQNYFLQNLPKKIAGGLLEVYKPFLEWFDKKEELKSDEVEDSAESSDEVEDSAENSNVDFDTMIPIVEKLGFYIIGCNAEKIRSKQEEILKKLTGEEDIQRLVKVVSPKLVQNLLASEKFQEFLTTLPFDAYSLLKNNSKDLEHIGNALMLALVSNLAQEVFVKEIQNGEQVPVDQFIFKTSIQLWKMFVKNFNDLDSIDNLPAKDLSVEQFQPLAKQLMLAFLPKNKFVKSFFERRKERLTKHFSSVLKKFYESFSLQSSKQDYRERLKNVLGGQEELVRQIDNFCFNITNLGRQFIVKEFSNPDVILKQLEATFGNQETSSAPPLLRAEIFDLSRAEIVDLLQKEFASDTLFLEMLERIVEKLIKFCRDKPKDILDAQELSNFFLEEQLELPVELPGLMLKAISKELLAIPAPKLQNSPDILTKVASGLSQIVNYNEPPLAIGEMIAILEKKVNVNGASLLNVNNLSLEKLKVIVEESIQICKDQPEILRDAGELVNYLKTQLDLTDIDDSVLKAISDELLTMIAPKLQTGLHLTLFKSIVHFLEKASNGGQTPLNDLFPQAFQILLDEFAEKAPVIVAKIKEISDASSSSYIEDEAKKDHELQTLFKPLVDKLIGIFFEDDKNLSAHLPVPVEIQPFIEGIIRNNAHKLILPLITAFTPWIEAKEENKERLDTVFGNKHASETCRIVGAITSQSVPYALQEFHEGFAKTLTKQLAVLFISPKSESLDKKKVKSELKPLRKMISYSLKSLSTNQTPSMQALLKFVENFAEAGMLRCFADLAEGLESLENQDKKLLLKGALSLLEELKDHFSWIAEVKKDLKKYRAGNVPHEDMMQKFAEKKHLHPALADKNLEERAKFFEKFSEDLFEIIGVGKETNLPIPHFLKEPLWELFQNELVPLLLLELFETIQNPHNLNLMLISLFEQINSGRDNVDVTISDGQLVIENDDDQKKLEKTSADLIQALVQMQPSALTRLALKNAKVKSLVGQAVGQPLRAMIKEKTLIKIIDDLLVSLAPSLHPGRWDPVLGNYIYEDQKGQETLTPKFTHLFPMTEWEKYTHEKDEIEAQKRAEKQVVRDIAHTMENQMQYIFLGTIRSIWAGFRKYLDKGLDKLHSSRLKRWINAFLDGVANYLIRPILVIMTFPILFAIKRLLRFYFVHQSTIRVEDVNHKIHQNALYRAIDEIIDLIKNAKNSSQETSTDEEETSSLDPGSLD